MRILKAWRQKTWVPGGHYYSPLVDPLEAQRDADRIWPESPMALGIDFQAARQREILSQDFPRFLGEFDYPSSKPASDQQFFDGNRMFGGLDARALFVLLRKLRPRRMIEVGSGYSSLLSADVNQRFLDGQMHLTCVEPHPPKFLDRTVPGITQLIRQRVQDLPVNEFQQLRNGDILFVDSSHVAKTGSDVNFLIFEVLPRLQPGVVIHFHDIFLPDDYPRKWVFEGRNWNEQYLLRALLMDSRVYEVLFGSAYAVRILPDELRTALGGLTLSGASFWIRKIT